MQRLDTVSLMSKLNQRTGGIVTCSIHDYQAVTPTLCRAVVAFNTLDCSESVIASAISRIFKGKAAAVAGSFRQLKGASLPSAVGFIRANNEVKPYDAKEASKMKVMASNLLMSQEDETLWEVRSSGNAKYLARQAPDDLSSLVVLAKVRGTMVPRLTQIAQAPAQRDEFVAFVDTVAEEVCHGFVVASLDTGCIVLDTMGNEVEVAYETIVESAHLNNDLKEYAAKAGIEAPIGNDKAAMVEYYKEVYAYDPAYSQMMVEIINSHATV